MIILFENQKCRKCSIEKASCKTYVLITFLFMIASQFYHKIVGKFQLVWSDHIDTHVPEWHNFFLHLNENLTKIVQYSVNIWFLWPHDRMETHYSKTIHWRQCAGINVQRRKKKEKKVVLFSLWLVHLISGVFCQQCICKWSHLDFIVRIFYRYIRLHIYLCLLCSLLKHNKSKSVIYQKV